MAKVTQRYLGEPVESLLRRFKKKCVRDNILGDMRKKEAYEKPSERKTREANERRKRIARATAKMQMLDKN